MKLSEEILACKRWKKWMKDIDKNCLPEIFYGFYCHHGEKHALAVARNAEKFLRDTGATEREIELARVASLLHDIGSAGGIKEKHALRSASIAREYLEGRLSSGDLEIVLHAIADHSGGEDMRNLVDVAVCIGDKLDVSGDRVRTDIEGGNGLTEQMLGIRDVEFDISGDTAILRLYASEGFEVEIWKEWNKAVEIPKKVAKWLKKGFKVEKIA